MRLPGTYISPAETGFYLTGTRYYNPEVGRFINADTTEVLTATPMALTDKNLFAYCDNNPIARADNSGAFWDTVLDVASLCVSVVDVVRNPDDVNAWLSLGLDAACLLIPFATGGGAIAKIITKADDVVDVSKTINKVDDCSDVVKQVDFYVTPSGDTIPATSKGFNDNLSLLEKKNSKYYGNDSKGPVRIRVEQHSPTIGYTGPYNPYHCEPHFHIDRRSKRTTGEFRKVYTGLRRWLR